MTNGTGRHGDQKKSKPAEKVKRPKAKPQATRPPKAAK
jgi:hypothetical protein